MCMLLWKRIAFYILCCHIYLLCFFKGFSAIILDWKKLDIWPSSSGRPKTYLKSCISYSW